ncbi:MAG TPA: plastocyanin/azurin family copper-binding protein, partial [Actinomycetota bacterium]|nr:plastocyanin/azurin family copper-binding protein [Actinomycetota bacterium]
GNRYVPGDSSLAPLPPQVIFEGDSLRHTNQDQDLHDLMALDNGPDGKPWFQSKLIGPGETDMVPVEGLKPGVYSYTCSIHPFMGGRLEVRKRLEPQEPAPDHRVDSGENYFAPKTITVVAGSSIEWTNVGRVGHSVTASDGSWDSHPTCPTPGPCHMPGERYRRTFTEPGTIRYYCKLHGTPGGTGHAGTIVVVPRGDPPSSVDSLFASGGPSVVSVQGSASFGGELPVAVASDPSGDAPAAAAADRTGLDLTGASVYRADPSLPHLTFEWRLAALPDAGIPEAVRYSLPFRAGSQRFVVQAKRTNLTGTTIADDPAGHASAQPRFQLLGDCTESTPASCRHIAWLDGHVDLAAKAIRAKVPFGIRPEIAPGATLERATGSVARLTRIEAALEAASTTIAADDAEWGGANASFAYTIASPVVRLGIAPTGTPEEQVVFSTTASVGTDGGFTGGIATGDLPRGTYDVWARACFGTNCGATKRTLEI